MKTLPVVIITFLTLYSLCNYAQEIPVGTWRTHNSFNAIRSISISSNRVYGAASAGVMIFDKSDNSVSMLSKLDGLSSTGITQVVADETRQQVIITYADGMIDILAGGKIIGFDRLKTSPTITGSRTIHHVLINGNLAYLSTDVGVVVFDLTQREIRETFRDLGAGGASLKIFKSAIKNDSIYLATENGVLAGNLNDNLLDFNKWVRYTTGSFSGSVKSVVLFNNAVHAAISGSGIYRFSNGSWVLQSYLQNISFTEVSSSNNLLWITEGSTVWSISTSGVITSLASDKFPVPQIAVADSDGTIYIGDKRTGLATDKTGGFTNVVPNGPTFSEGMRLKYTQRVDFSNKDMIYAVSGSYLSNGLPSGKNESLNYFLSGSWIADETVVSEDLTDVDFFSPSKVCLSSYGKGLQVIHESGGKDFYDNNNSTLTNNRITAIESSKEGLWVAEYGVATPLHLFNVTNGTWQAFALPFAYPVEIKVDNLGYVWMILNPSLGGGLLVFDRAGNRYAYLTDSPASGSLPSRSVHSLALDRNGYMWVGTAAGVAYFPDPSRVFISGTAAIRPIFENRFLLRDERVTAIAVDGGDRKWMGTERGVWLFNPVGDEQLQYFNTSNSPLLSDKIVDLEICNRSGEVFMLTDAGIVSYRADATVSNGFFSNVKIFPNPVTASFSGQVAMSGLATHATVKITDVAGKLVWQTYANGGTATWNVRDYNGVRVSTGMYLVIATAADGSESVVGKIAVID